MRARAETAGRDVAITVFEMIGTVHALAPSKSEWLAAASSKPFPILIAKAPYDVSVLQVTLAHAYAVKDNKVLVAARGVPLLVSSVNAVTAGAVRYATITSPPAREIKEVPRRGFAPLELLAAPTVINAGKEWAVIDGRNTKYTPGFINVATNLIMPYLWAAIALLNSGKTADIEDDSIDFDKIEGKYPTLRILLEKNPKLGIKLLKYTEKHKWASVPPLFRPLGVAFEVPAIAQGIINAFIDEGLSVSTDYCGNPINCFIEVGDTQIEVCPKEEGCDVEVVREGPDGGWYAGSLLARMIKAGIKVEGLQIRVIGDTPVVTLKGHGNFLAIGTNSGKWLVKRGDDEKVVSTDGLVSIIKKLLP